MSKFGIINLIDKLFITIAIFLIIFAWINFYITNLWITLLISLFFTLSAVFILYYFLNKRNNKISTSKKQIEEVNKNFFNFRLMSKTKKCELLKTILRKNYEVKANTKKILYKKDGLNHQIVFAIQYEKLSQNDLLNLIDEFSEDIDCYDIICNTFCPTINTKIYIDKDINLIDKERLYLDFFFKNNIYPYNPSANTKVTKIKFLDIVKGMFVPEKSKSYFLCGLVLIFSSIILPYHIYYIVFGSILILFSILSKILPKLMKDKFH